MSFSVLPPSWPLTSSTCFACSSSPFCFLSSLRFLSFTLRSALGWLWKLGLGAPDRVKTAVVVVEAEPLLLLALSCRSFPLPFSLSLSLFSGVCTYYTAGPKPTLFPFFFFVCLDSQRCSWAAGLVTSRGLGTRKK